MIRKKEKLRTVVLNRLKTQDEKERKRKENIIFKKVIKTNEYIRANVIMAYYSMSYEVSTIEIIENAFKNGKRVVLPLMDTEKKIIIPCEVANIKDDLVVCKYGFKEPVESLKYNVKTEEIELVLVPGMAFTRDGKRLGRGAGYYDKFLQLVLPSVPRIGLAFDFQIVPSIPTEKHDQLLSFVITN